MRYLDLITIKNTFLMSFINFFHVILSFKQLLGRINVNR